MTNTSSSYAGQEVVAKHLRKVGGAGGGAAGRGGAKWKQQRGAPKPLLLLQPASAPDWPAAAAASLAYSDRRLQPAVPAARCSTPLCRALNPCLPAACRTRPPPSAQVDALLRKSDYPAAFTHLLALMVAGQRDSYWYMVRLGGGGEWG